MNENRLERVLTEMEKQGLTQMLISSPSAVFYLTGKWIEPGERMLTFYINISGDKKLIINELFPINEKFDFDLIRYSDTEDPVKRLCEFVDHSKPLGIDKNWPSHFLIRLMEKKGVSVFVNGSYIIDRIRMIKDSEEIKLMKKASSINDKVMEEIVNEFSSNRSEKEMCTILRDLYESKGTQGFSFYPIIAYGANAADPHHDSGNSLVKDGDSIIIDMGCRNKYYCSDMTRTFFFGEPSKEAERVYNIVYEANLNAISKIKPGTRFCDIDRAARAVIEGYNYGKYFTHRTGHSIGIEVHDFGDVSSINEETVQPGMIFSIEPGIYLPGSVGVRIEDLVLVTENGCEVLNKYSKELRIFK
ncbi:proline dipeptidase [Clostridium polyendosporum]|uniref:Proline dipeptidase n=1 Tax=Clostridium polyendosporum TaxID=69208 RepID=A0A919VG44_9CLOT|nr:Xaa-Pro peptidase family protein [Clostridium polyendosporum]GIM29055.1 proline dipeptidase [Clostridium polyendosporum]